MQQRKKQMLSLVVILLCLTMIVPTAAASGNEEDISPQYMVVITFGTSFDIDNNGRSTCTGKGTVETNYTIDITMELQQKKGNSWETIKTWTDSGRRVNLEENWYVDSGYYYRIKLSGEATNSSGKVIESPETYSGVQYY